MTLDQYQEFVPTVNYPYNNDVVTNMCRSLAPSVSLGDVLYAALGVGGEAGEVQDLIKKWVFHQSCLDIEHLKKEMGDVLWYLALLCNSFNIRMEDLLQINADKLNARYPHGFCFSDANNRKPEDI